MLQVHLEINFFLVTHHCDDLKVFKVSPLCSKNFFGDKIGLVSWITLKQKQSKVQNRAMDSPTTIKGAEWKFSMLTVYLPPSLFLLFEPDSAAHLT